MKKNYITIAFFLIIITNSISQNKILCSIQYETIKIENPNNIPLVLDNNDGSITLTHSNQNITDIFANYKIYGFYQSFPNSNPSGELFKYYTISHGNKSLIEELYNYPDVFIIEKYVSTSISADLIELLDGKTYNLVKHCYEADEYQIYCPENEKNIPVDFELKIAFTYDAEKEIMYAETKDLSSCGNYFKIGFKGGINFGNNASENTLSLWESENEVSTITDDNLSCHNIEQALYSALDIGCMNFNIENIKINFGSKNGQFIIERATQIFSTNFFTFEQDILSVEKNFLDKIQVFQTSGNPYLQISNLTNESVTCEIYTISGQKVINSVKFENSMINISHLATGLYFVKISNLKNQQKVLKFLKN